MSLPETQSKTSQKILSQGPEPPCVSCSGLFSFPQVEQETQRGFLWYRQSTKFTSSLDTAWPRQTLTTHTQFMSAAMFGVVCAHPLCSARCYTSCLELLIYSQENLPCPETSFSQSLPLFSLSCRVSDPTSMTKLNLFPFMPSLCLQRH